MKVTKKRTFAIAGIAMLAMTMLAGCAGTADKADTEGEVTNSTYEQEYAAWTAKYDACLKEQGIELPKRKPNELVNLDSLGVDVKVFEKASRECSSKVGTAPVDPNVPTEDEFYDMQLAFAKCMRGAGYDWEDPAPPADGMSAGAKPIDPSKYDEADLNKCAETAGFGTGSK